MDEDDLREAAEPLIKRLDAGLVTAIAAVLVSFLALLTSWRQNQMLQETQKAQNLPIIQVDMGYDYKTQPIHFDISLQNSGNGMAYIQRVTPLKDGKPVENYLDFQNALMTGRMRSNAMLKELPSTGYLPAGQALTPWYFDWGSSVNSRSEIRAYLRGDFGAPMHNVDIEVCYCSVFDDCWTTKASNQGKPAPAKSCGKDDTRLDYFQKYSVQRAAQ